MGRKLERNEKREATDKERKLKKAKGNGKECIVEQVERQNIRPIQREKMINSDDILYIRVRKK